MKSVIFGFRMRLWLILAVWSVLLCPPAEILAGKALAEAMDTLPQQNRSEGGAMDAFTTTPGSDRKETLDLTIVEAVLMALENNRSLVVERLRPLIQKTFEDQEQALFDPVLKGSVALERSQVERQVAGPPQSVSADTFRAGISLEQFFPTGTFVQFGADTQTTDSSLNADPFTETGIGLTINQPLLRGLGRDTNLARLRQARIETDISQFELRGYTENLVAQIENAYWEYGLARRQIEIVDESLKLAEQQLAETRVMITVGTLAEAELAAGQALVATQRQALINAKSALSASRLRLLRLLNPPDADFWNLDINLVHEPVLPEAPLEDVVLHVDTALKMRPEVNQAQLALEVGNLELVRTRNGLLPRMDLFVNLGKSGYAQSFGGSVSDIGGDGYYLAGGLSFALPLKNRAAEAQHSRAGLSREQIQRALENLNQLVTLDVRIAYVEVGRTREQIDASQATRRFQEENLRIETERFRVGRSTLLLVSQVQRDYLVSRINEVQAVVNYLNALTTFYRLEGSLLQRRGIVVPGKISMKD